MQIPQGKVMFIENRLEDGSYQQCHLCGETASHLHDAEGESSGDLCSLCENGLEEGQTMEICKPCFIRTTKLKADIDYLNSLNA